MAKYHLVRKELEIPDTKTIQTILKQSKYSTLSLCRDNEPYIVTLNHGYDEKKNALYFHCAKKGLKLQIIKANPLVCGTIIDDRGYLPGQCDHRYRSLVFYGKITIIKSLAEIKHGFDIMMNHLEQKPKEVSARIFAQEDKYHKAFILRLDIEEITGKQSNP